MSICCCSLAGTRACETCPNAPMNIGGFSGKYNYPRKPRRVTEEYDENGKLIKRITED